MNPINRLSPVETDNKNRSLHLANDSDYVHLRNTPKSNSTMPKNRTRFVLRYNKPSSVNAANIIPVQTTAVQSETLQEDKSLEQEETDEFTMHQEQRKALTGHLGQVFEKNMDQVDTMPAGEREIKDIINQMDHISFMVHQENIRLPNETPEDLPTHTDAVLITTLLPLSSETPSSIISRKNSSSSSKGSDHSIHFTQQNSSGFNSEDKRGFDTYIDKVSEFSGQVNDHSGSSSDASDDTERLNPHGKTAQGRSNIFKHDQAKSSSTENLDTGPLGSNVGRVSRPPATLAKSTVMLQVENSPSEDRNMNSSESPRESETDINSSEKHDRISEFLEQDDVSKERAENHSQIESAQKYDKILKISEIPKGRFESSSATLSETHHKMSKFSGGVSAGGREPLLGRPALPVSMLMPPTDYKFYLSSDTLQDLWQNHINAEGTVPMEIVEVSASELIEYYLPPPDPFFFLPPMAEKAQDPTKSILGTGIPPQKSQGFTPVTPFSDGPQNFVPTMTDQPQRPKQIEFPTESTVLILDPVLQRPPALDHRLDHSATAVTSSGPDPVPQRPREASVPSLNTSPLAPKTEPSRIVIHVMPPPPPTAVPGSPSEVSNRLPVDSTASSVPPGMAQLPFWNIRLSDLETLRSPVSPTPTNERTDAQETRPSSGEVTPRVHTPVRVNVADQPEWLRRYIVTQPKDTPTQKSAAPNAQVLSPIHVNPADLPTWIRRFIGTLPPQLVVRSPEDMPPKMVVNSVTEVLPDLMNTNNGGDQNVGIVVDSGSSVAFAPNTDGGQFSLAPNMGDHLHVTPNMGGKESVILTSNTGGNTVITPNMSGAIAIAPTVEGGSAPMAPEMGVVYLAPGGGHIRLPGQNFLHVPKSSPPGMSAVPGLAPESVGIMLQPHGGQDDPSAANTESAKSDSSGDMFVVLRLSPSSGNTAAVTDAGGKERQQVITSQGNQQSGDQGYSEVELGNGQKIMIRIKKNPGEFVTTQPTTEKANVHNNSPVFPSQEHSPQPLVPQVPKQQPVQSFSVPSTGFNNSFQPQDKHQGLAKPATTPSQDLLASSRPPQNRPVHPYRPQQSFSTYRTPTIGHAQPIPRPVPMPVAPGSTIIKMPGGPPDQGTDRFSFQDLSKFGSDLGGLLGGIGGTRGIDNLLLRGLLDLGKLNRLKNKLNQGLGGLTGEFNKGLEDLFNKGNLRGIKNQFNKGMGDLQSLFNRQRLEGMTNKLNKDTGKIYDKITNTATKINDKLQTLVGPFQSNVESSFKSSVDFLKMFFVNVLPEDYYEKSLTVLAIIAFLAFLHVRISLMISSLGQSSVTLGFLREKTEEFMATLKEDQKFQVLYDLATSVHESIERWTEEQLGLGSFKDSLGESVSQFFFGSSQTKENVDPADGDFLRKTLYVPSNTSDALSSSVFHSPEPHGAYSVPPYNNAAIYGTHQYYPYRRPLVSSSERTELDTRYLEDPTPHTLPSDMSIPHSQGASSTIPDHELLHLLHIISSSRSPTPNLNTSYAFSPHVSKTSNFDSSLTSFSSSPSSLSSPSSHNSSYFRLPSLSLPSLSSTPSNPSWIHSLSSSSTSPSLSPPSPSLWSSLSGASLSSSHVNQTREMLLQEVEALARLGVTLVDLGLEHRRRQWPPSGASCLQLPICHLNSYSGKMGGLSGLTFPIIRYITIKVEL